MNLEIKTNRLILRRPFKSDAQRLADLLNNYAVASNLAHVKLPYAKEDTELWLPRLIATRTPQETGFIIEQNDTGIVGIVSFRRDGEATVLGYWLGEAYWGQGIMTEALIAAHKWYFETTNEDIVNSGIFHFNMASLAIQHKLGFVETGSSLVHCLARGKDIEHIDTELTREAFEAAIK